MTEMVVIMAKMPESGVTKTRLSPPLTQNDAAELYACFLQDTQLNLKRLTPGIRKVIAYAPESALEYFIKTAGDFELVFQVGANLGERLNMVMNWGFQQGCTKVILMDSDSPTLPLTCLTEAFELLDHVDVVIGPCEDGGYYLIGGRQPIPGLLLGVEMSTPRVCKDTLRIASRLKLKTCFLPLWYDVDDAISLDRLRRDLAVTKDELLAPTTRKFLNKLAEKMGPRDTI